MSLKQFLKNISRWNYIKKVYIKGAESNIKCSRKIKRKMNRKGFSSDQYFLYGFDNGNNIKEYISEFERWLTRQINGKANVIVDNKIAFYDAFHTHFDVPKNLFTIIEHRMMNENGKIVNKDEFNAILGRFIAKPISGTGGGKGVALIEFSNGNATEKGELVAKTLEEFCRRYEGYLLNDVVKQNNYASRIAPNSLNTIRIVTIRDKKTGLCKCVVAIHRFGSKKSEIVDNACRGGVFGIVDLETGIIKQAASMHSKQKYDCHPDFGTKIAGVKIPNFHNIVKQLIEVHNKKRYLDFIGWDIALIDDEHFVVIEGNGSSDVTLLQLFGGLRNSQYGLMIRQYGCLLKKND